MARITVYLSDEVWDACKAANTSKLNTSQLMLAALKCWLEVIDPVTADVLRMTPSERTQALIKAEREQYH